MNSKLLIDAIVRQTTVLIAQLSTAAGIRAPLAHVADQVFVSLAREIEAQGVSRKVVADMFGIALRTYQKKVQRLTESATLRDRTLWEAVLDFLTENGSVSRARVLERFERDGERAVTSVLNDLVTTGLAYSSGRGEAMVYGVTTEAERRQLSADHGADSVTALAWARIYREPGITTAQLCYSLGAERELVRGVIDELVREGRVTRTGDGDAAALRAATLVVPTGSEAGWEGAVYDHFQAVANAIAAKVRRGATRSKISDHIGGATLSFDLHPTHPHRDQVLAILARVRADLNALWSEVAEHNRIHPIPDAERMKVTFYFGQNVEDPRQSELDAGGGPAEPIEPQVRAIRGGPP